MNLHITKRRVVYGAIVLGVLVLVALVVRPKPVDVEAAAVGRESLVVTIDDDGRTRAIDTYLVVAPVSGQLRRISVREGARVNAGEIVAMIEPAPQDVAARVQVQSDLIASTAGERAANATFQHASASYAQAKREYDRRAVLRAAGALSAEDLEHYALAVRAAEEARNNALQAVRTAEAQSAAARARAHSVSSPSETAVPVRPSASGTVLRVPERSGRMVSAGEPLLEIGNTTALEAVVDVLSEDAVRINPGQRAIVTNWGGEPTDAYVRRIEPAAFTRVSALGVEEQRVNVILGFSDCPPTMGAGYGLDAAIVVWSGTGVLVGPVSAFFRRGREWAAFTVRDGRVRIRTVELGERSSDRVQIRSGLQAGDVVIVFPGDELKENMRVKPRLTGI